MRTRLLIAVSGSVLALTACGKNDRAADNTAATDTNIAMDNGAMTAPMAADPLTSQGFANAAAASDKFEIESSKLAATASQSAAVKSYAQKMISAHEESSAKLKSTLGGMTPAVAPDDTLNAEQQASLDSLKGKTAAEAESLFERIHAMLTSDTDVDFDAQAEELGKLAVFSGVREYPARVKCASLSWHALHSALQGDDTPVSTE